MTDFWRGMMAWWNGWRHIFRHRVLLAAAGLPFLISLAAAAASLYLLAIYYPLLMNSLVMNWLGSIESLWLALLIKPLIWIGGLVVTLLVLYAVYVLHAIVAQPFYAVLADRTLRLKGYAPVEANLWSMLRMSLLKGVLFLCVGVLLFVCSFIPGLNLLAVAGTLFLLSYDCVDYSLEARGLSLRARFRYIFAHAGQWCGLTVGLALTLLLPGLTLLVIPGAVVGAALILKETK